MQTENQEIITEQVDKLIINLSVPYLMRKFNLTHEQALKRCKAALHQEKI